MRLLQIISSTNPEAGGVIEGVRQSSEGLVNLGCSVEVASCDAADSPWLKDFPFPIHALGPGKGGYQLTPNLVPWLLENGTRFDAVIANGIWQFPSYAVRKAMRQLRKPYFVFTHGMLDPWFKRTYPLKHFKKALYWPLGEYRVLRDAAAVLFTTEEEKFLARQSFRMYRANEVVVSYGTSAPTGDAKAQANQFRNAFPQLKERPFLLFLSRIHPKKGVDLLIHAFTEVYRESPLQLVVAGPDQVGWAEELKKLATQLKIQDRIHWTGMLTGDLKWGAYHACEAFILPSHQENFGIVVAEALACGKPALISNKVNIWREVEAEGAGIVADDTILGASFLIQTWQNTTENQRSKMKSQATCCFRQNFEIQASARTLLSALQEYSHSNHT